MATSDRSKLACERLVGSMVKFHWSRPALPAFCHIIELIARSASTSVSWNQRQPSTCASRH